jgi:hypothetical protein
VGESNDDTIQTTLAAQFRSPVVDELRLLAYPNIAASQRLRFDNFKEDIDEKI